MRRGFLSIDAFMTFFLLISIFTILINFSIKNKEAILPWIEQLHVISSVMANGFIISEVNSDSVGNGQVMINYDKYYDIEKNKNETISFNISDYNLYLIHNGKFYSFPVFAQGATDYGFGAKITLLSGGGQPTSNKSISLNITTCTEVLKQIQSGYQYYYDYKTVLDKRPWNCDDSCMGGYDTCAYNCDPSSGLDCNVQCKLVDADLKLNITPTENVTVPTNERNIGFVLKGPYYNSTLIINDTCGYFPSLDPNCNKDFDPNSMRELFVYVYEFNLNSYPMSEVYLNVKARNGVIVEINNKTIACVATGEESQRSLRIRRYLRIGKNVIKIGFVRTDSICNPCVTVRPAYSVSGAVQFSCDPSLPSYTVQDFFGWYGCEDKITPTAFVQIK